MPLSEQFAWIFMFLFGLLPNIGFIRPGQRLIKLSSVQYGSCLIGLSLSFFILAANSFCSPIESLYWPVTEGKITHFELKTLRKEKNYYIDLSYSLNGKVHSRTQKISFFNTFISASNVGENVKVHYDLLNPELIGFQMSLSSTLSSILTYAAIAVVLDIVGIGLILAEKYAVDLNKPSWR